ncbi:sensor histidine kinase [Brevibacterium antiquum]|uniref:histidine kinase n=1 Tax=Brevibacterium antiquum CNRZ 918 TaxID=1255637 RepID=A0A2H1JPW1_9MICO|nr:histidine kinase [Brevibacterium antiquum]SMX89536.1 Signal transduction histidine kinase [Brevibacterium antiquum CNRZ 918]
MLFSKLFDRFLPPDRRFNPEALAWVAVIFTAIVMLAVESSIAVGVHEVPVALAFIVTVIHAGSMPLSMLRPLFGAIVSVIACGVLPLLGPYLSGAPWPWMVPMMITQTLIILIVGLRAHWGVALAALLASIAISAAAAVFGHIQYSESRSDSAIVNIVVFSCIAGGFYVAAVIVQQWHLIRSQLLQEQENTAEEHSKRVVVEEKTRIARELHDIVAHSMSIINIQASSAPFRHPNIDSDVEKEFEDISVSARHALTEMRGLLGVLRNDDSGQELAPQPKFSEVEGLVKKAQQAGVNVTMERSGEPLDHSLRDSTGLAGYRIVQEALSNAIRHAAESQIHIKVDSGGTALWINVVNTAGKGPTEAAKNEAHRHQGLIGMRERAASVGGELRTGWSSSGGFEVEAVLPLAVADAHKGDSDTSKSHKTDSHKTDSDKTSGREVLTGTSSGGTAKNDTGADADDTADQSQGDERSNA